MITPQVVCQPVVRPGQSMCYGYDGIAQLARDMHAAHGNYQIQIDEIAERPGPVVTVRARILPEPGHGLGPLPVTTCYEFRDGLIVSVDSQEGSGAP